MIDPELIAAAKRDMDRLRLRAAIENLSPEDRMLMMKYPKHTLAAARLIDSTPTPHVETGYTSGFEKLIAQERGNFHLSGDHT